MPPWLFLALAVSLLAALGYEIGGRRSLRRVPLYWLIILSAFLAAEAAVDSISLGTPRLGELQIVPDLIGLAAALLLMKAIKV